MSDAHDRLSTALSDRYRVERELGAGGMATVYLAHDLKHDRPVALKVLRPELGAILGGARFLSEIKTTAKLQHPHILPLLDSGAAAGLLYYVMPYVEGETLRARLERERQLGVDEVLRLVRALAGALDYAHAQGVIHRDLKPENILFQANEPVLADFGIALAVATAGGERLTETGLSLGTPHYMSPEQATGERGVDARSDVYALGCVVYEMLAGEPPHTGPTTAAILAKLMTQVPVALGVVRPGLPGHVEAAVMRALAKAPGDRFATAGAFAMALAAPAERPSEPSEKSIVVLPFDNLSPDPNDAYLADGLTEELISDLSRIRALKVIARNSAVAVKQRTRDVEEVARLMKVRYVLEGSVRRAGNALRITAQLIDGATNAHVWSEKYQGTMDDVFAMQEQVSRAIANSLSVVLTRDESQRLGSPGISNPRAYEYYLLAKREAFTFSLASVNRALALLDRGLEHAGENALLLATKAFFMYRRQDYRPTPDHSAIREGLVLAERALALDQSCAMAWMARGMLRCFEPPGFRLALGDVRRAVKLEPGNVEALQFQAIVSMLVGRFAEAEQALTTVRRLDPEWPTDFLLGSLEYYRGRPEAAARLWQPMSQVAFNEPVLGLWYALTTLAPQRRVDELGRLAAHLAQSLPGEPLFSLPLFLYHGIRGHRQAALDLVSSGLRDVALHGAPCYTAFVAAGYILLEEYDEAMSLISHAADAGLLVLADLAAHDPLLAPLRSRPDFSALVAMLKAEQLQLSDE